MTQSPSTSKNSDANAGKVSAKAEEWRSVASYEGWYEVSSLGRVRRMHPARRTFVGRLLKPRRTKTGYLGVILYKNGKRCQVKVHRLVAGAFIGPCPDGQETNHIDGVKSHNEVENLEYVTHLQNQGHAARIGLYKSVEGAMNPAAKLSEDDVREIRTLLRTWTVIEVAQSFGVCKQTIYNIAANRTWSSVEEMARVV